MVEVHSGKRVVLVWSAESIREAGHIPNFFMFLAYGLFLGGLFGIYIHIHD
jgi:hypothetical protein